MKLSDLQYIYPEDLIATEPSRPSRVMWVQSGRTPIELTTSELLAKIPEGDVFVINNTQVLKRRVFAQDETEILFLNQVDQKNNLWEVLFPAKKFKLGDEISLPMGFRLRLIEKGRPQIVSVEPAITETDFEKIAELPLPPYIQKARQSRHNVEADESWYQTGWARHPGSFAAPTASLHFQKQQIEELKKRGVRVVEVTLHVGLGTFLPVTVEDLNDHQMHSEYFSISATDWDLIEKQKSSGARVWCLGTTSTRVVETVARTRQLSGCSQEVNLKWSTGCSRTFISRNPHCWPWLPDFQAYKQSKTATIGP
jgi:S-adenosylmethionine:tRNA ribosyltransferase-isomerase